jgi:hypothetical protein
MRLTNWFALIAMLGTWGAQAQTYPNLYSPWMPWDTRIKYTGTLSLLDASGAEVNKASIKSLFNTVTVVFPVQVAGATVPKVRVSLTAVGTNDKGVVDLAVTTTLDYTLSPSYTAVAGSNPTFIYTPMSFSPTLVATAPMPVVVVPPPVVPPVVVPPPPPPVPTPVVANKPGDSVPPLAKLVDIAGAVWTFIPPKVFRNGIDMNNQYLDATRLYVSQNNSVRVDSPSHGYICLGIPAGTGC